MTTRSLTLVCIAILISLNVEAGTSKVKRHASGVPGEFIVLLPDNTPTSAVASIARILTTAFRLKLGDVWPNAVKGFRCYGDGDGIDRLAGDTRVFSVEQNVRGQFAPEPSGTQYTFFDPLYDPSCSPNNPDPAKRPPNCTATQNYLWFLDRIDKPGWASRDGYYNMCPEGRGVIAYVLDYGVRKDHPEFEWNSQTGQSRVIAQRNFTSDMGTFACDSPDNTHGTWVAGVLAGTHVGASKADVVSLKIVPCSGPADFANWIAAVDWIADPQNNPYYGQPAVISQSTFIPSWESYFSSYEDAVSRVVVATNIPFFKSADNYSADACKFSPNHAAFTNVNKTGKTVFVVGGISVTPCRVGDPGYPNCPVVSSDNNDYRYQRWNSDGTAVIGQNSGSNGGDCVSAYAPAAGIYVANNQLGYQVVTGTSFSAPLAAGLAARYVRQQYDASPIPKKAPSYIEVYNFLLSQATAPVLLDQTPEYYLCGITYGTTGAIANSYPFTCDSSHFGEQGLGTAAFHMLSTTNTTSARVLNWDTASCP
jgi:Subtilisin-like serine proteases